VASVFAHRVVYCSFLGDYHEIPQTCPFMTTCPVVCVAKVKDCPTACADNTSGWSASSVTSLCVTGSCEMDCSQYDADMDNPCPCPLFPIACPKVVEYYDECFAMFQPFYDGNVCPEEEEYSIPQVSTSAFFTAFYTWIAGLTALMVCWFYYNEKLCPSSDTTSMRMREGALKSTRGHSLYQHGYRRCILGTALYAMVIVTVIGIQFLFFFLTICFYMAAGSITRWPPVFYDPDQVLRVFVSVWFVGFTWTVSLRYMRDRTDLDCLFLRRCLLSAATHVLVVAPAEAISPKRSQVRLSVRCVRWLSGSCSTFLHALFPNPGNVAGKDAIFCRVTLDKVSGNRWISYRLRRYVFDSDTGGYTPGCIHVGTRLGDFVVQGEGLTTEDVIRRRGIVGLNKAIMPKPTFASSLAAEFSKKFYVYQVFIFVGLVL
jgi:hypothetical protein